MIRPLLLALLLAATPVLSADFLPGVRRIVFLGDSITHSGQYIDQFEAYLAVAHADREFEVIDLGLPSETVSGLSEEGHAGGKFPRPDLHERLDRALAQSKPDLVIACYGMNDGIYRPFGERRFRLFKEGMKRLHQAAVNANVRIVHLTPPVFDAEPIKDKVDPTGEKPGAQFAGYDDVLARYAEWLVSMRDEGWAVVDIHSEMRRTLDSRRAADPAFVFAKDGVHPNDAGHWVISTELVGELAGPGRSAATAMMTRLHNSPEAKDLLKIVRERGRIVTDAWVAAVGHGRPGMPAGLPLEDAREKAEKLAPKIRKQAAEFLANAAGQK